MKICTCEITNTQLSEQAILHEISYCAMHKAAPELLGACQMWVDYFAKLEEISDPDDPLSIARANFHRKRLEATKAAIAKAGG